MERVWCSKHKEIFKSKKLSISFEKKKHEKLVQPPFPFTKKICPKMRSV